MKWPNKIYLNHVPLEDKPDVDFKIWTQSKTERYESKEYVLKETVLKILKTRSDIDKMIEKIESL